VSPEYQGSHDDPRFIDLSSVGVVGRRDAGRADLPVKELPQAIAGAAHHERDWSRRRDRRPGTTAGRAALTAEPRPVTTCAADRSRPDAALGRLAAWPPAAWLGDRRLGFLDDDRRSRRSRRASLNDTAGDHHITDARWPR